MEIYVCSAGDRLETIILPTGLKLDELLEAGEEIFRDCENTNPQQRGSVDVLSLARRIADLVRLLAIGLFQG